MLNTYWVEGNGIDLTDSSNIWRLGIAVHEPNVGWVACPSWGYPQERWDRRGNRHPMQLRFTIVAVAEGAEFSGWEAWVADPPTDGISEGPTRTATRVRRRTRASTTLCHAKRVRKKV